MSIGYTWKNDTWEKRYKDVYNDKGNQTSEISYLWENSTWKEWGKEENLYDDKGNLIRIIITSYDWEKNTWKEDAKWEYTCDEMGNQILEILCIGKTEYEKYEYTYDDIGNQTSCIYYDLKNNTLMKISKEEYIHDLSYSKKDLIAPSDYHSNNMLTKIRRCSWDGTEWSDFKVNAIYYWSEKTIQ